MISRHLLADARYMYGDFKLRQKDYPAARRGLQESLDLRKKMVEDEPRDALLKRDLGVSYYRLGLVADREKKPDEARAAFDEARKIREALVALSENNDRRQMELMLALAHTGSPDRAAELADRLAAGPNVDREMRIDLARCYSQCARATPNDQPARQQALLTTGVDQLLSAVREGYRDRAYLEGEPDFDPLRDQDGFAAVLRDAAAP